MKKKYQLIIFDWDGTLMDSTVRITRCMQLALEAMEAPPRTEQAIINIIGLSLEEAIDTLYPDHSSTFIQKTAHVYREFYLFKDKTPSPLFSGVIDMLDELRAEGYDLAIATGKSRRGLDQDLRSSGLQDYFPITRCGDEAHSKPNPQMLEEILTDYNGDRTTSLMVGDSEYDLQMAKNARVKSLAVSYGVHPITRLLRLTPVAIVDNAREISTQIRILNGE
ncbi:MAG: HAD-IA family hydrolase [Cocleimonas sp.]|nr:HAD-IA family hydrolase [Cocleimonas sp.]